MLLVVTYSWNLSTRKAALFVLKDEVLKYPSIMKFVAKNSMKNSVKDTAALISNSLLNFLVMLSFFMLAYFIALSPYS